MIFFQFYPFIFFFYVFIKDFIIFNFILPIKFTFLFNSNNIFFQFGSISFLFVSLMVFNIINQVYNFF